MNIKRALCALAASTALFTVVPSDCNAEYITAYEDIKYEKYVVDTDSFFYPDVNDKENQFNCIVWYYQSANDKGQPYTFRFRFENNNWKVAERNKKKELIWVKVESKSIASGVLRACLPYIGHSASDK
jgi:hypothetical protein